jgi:hypothetical protein
MTSWFVPQDHRGQRLADHDVDLAGVRQGLRRVDRFGDHPVDLDGNRVLDGLAALEAGEVHQVVDQVGQTHGLALHPRGEALDGLGVVAGRLDRLGEQRQRPDRGLELVGHVGDEVAAYGVHALRLGQVLEQDEHGGGRERGDPGAQVEDAGAQRGSAYVDLLLADDAVAAHGGHERAHLGGGDPAPRDDAQGGCGGGGVEDRAVRAYDERGARQHGEQAGQALRDVGGGHRLGGGHRRAAATEDPRRATAHGSTHEGGRGETDGHVHGLRVRRAAGPNDRRTGRDARIRRLFTRATRCSPRRRSPFTCSNRRVGCRS